MGSSLILTGGVATAKTLREVITQPAHGFAVGDVLRWDAGSAKYRLAMADSAENAEVVGVVDTIDDASNFKLVYSGYLDVSTLAGITVPVLFLSGASAGKLVTTPPSSIGSVIKPVLTKANNTNGYVLTNYLGTQIGGSSTIAIDEIQPVGTIMPFAGNAIPDTWLECNGTSYDIASYTELYSKIITTDGDRVPAYGYVVEISLSSGSSAIWNAITVGDAIITNATSTTPTTTSYDIIGRVLSKTASLGGSHPLTVQIFPNYSATNKNFVYPNKSPLSLTGQVKAYSSGTGDPYYAVTNGTDRGGPGTINTVKIIKFNTPDMRGRVGVGLNSTNIGEWESDALISAISGNYPYGSFGGEERHTLTEGELPLHSHGLKAIVNALTTGSANVIGADNHNTNFSGTVATSALNGSDGLPPRTGATGGNASHNNMPPYLAVRYIIKAKPYTRAAVIDGVDLPYSNLLVRSTDSNSLRSELLSGVSGGDLVFYTNSGEASKTGTERMRLTVGGSLGIGTNSPVSSFNVWGASSVNGAANRGTLLVSNSTNSRQIQFGINDTSHVGWIEGWVPGLGGLTLCIQPSGSRVGIGTTGPTATLDVNGTLKVGNFGSATNVMAKPNMNAGSVGLVVPLLSSAGDLNSAGVYYITSALSEGTWLVFLQGFENAGSTNDADPVWVMFKVWTVPAGNYLVFSPNNDTLSETGNSGMSYRMNTSSMQTYTTANVNTVKGAPWVQLTAPTDVTIAGTYNPTGTQTGIVWDGKSQPLLASGYAIRIA
jgi:microcystin-dependent protein